MLKGEQCRAERKTKTMAHPDHPALLQWREVEQWNKWREREPEAQPDLSGADLHGTNLSGASLHEADLSKAYLVWANLRETDLAEADLSEANLRGANLYGAAFSDALIDGTDLRGIPWPLILELTRQPGVTWQDVYYD